MIRLEINDDLIEVKRKTLEPEEVVLPECPSCHNHSIVHRQPSLAECPSYEFCLKCDYRSVL